MTADCGLEVYQQEGIISGTKRIIWQRLSGILHAGPV